MPRERASQAKAARARRSKGAPSAPASPRQPGSIPVVGIGASAGGLDACRKLLDALPADSGMAFILVQHLDPTHESMLVDLLGGHTSMTVLQAADGMRLAPEHLYIIPPGTYLSVAGGALHLSPPQARHGARLPFDFLLHSMAADCGAHAVCVILSGTGADGSLGLQAVKQSGGLVIAQDPNEASYDGMPRNAIRTGLVDLVLPVAKIPAALIDHSRGAGAAGSRNAAPPEDAAQDWLPAVVDLLRTKTTHDFTLYKPGTLQRRIERRMGMAPIEPKDMGRYIELLRNDPGELNLLATDLLINVTNFFRDPEVFDFLAEKIVPDLVARQAPGHPLRIWIAGCSTGEETYSLAMLFLEQIAAARQNVKLQVFASDVDPDAIGKAREGLYPEVIEADVSPARLARFFSKEGRSYRVSPELRGTVVFTVQDLLADPPFSRLDLVSCRNLLIYLRPEAQAKVISLFHFALREGGILVLGNSETVANGDDRFEAISKPQRIFRHIGRRRPGELAFSVGGGDSVRAPPRPGQRQAPTRQANLAELCRRLVMESYAPAAVLINRQHEYLYSLGPTDRYLRVAPGQPTNDLLAMARPDMRTKLRAAIQQAAQDNTRVVVAGGRVDHGEHSAPFRIEVQPVQSDGEQLLLICFVDEPKHELRRGRPVSASEAQHVAELEQELKATRTELESAIRNLEISNEDQKAINEEALSLNEEFQSTNEELLTSKEELQSLNEELTALNHQLQETLERQRTTSNDLQNVLYSTNVATLFLDTDLKIRFFTPATRSLFNVIPGDVGRPLADLSSLAADDALVGDARTVLQTLAPIEREVETRDGTWFVRRILPYRTEDDGVGGVVITFVDVTERQRAAKALEAARREAELANIAKSRFLAAASHDLRQPLQTLKLIQGLLAKAVEGETAQRLLARLERTLESMAGILNALLDINRIEAGTVHPVKVDFPINDLLARMTEEFSLHAKTRMLAFRVVPCSLSIHSDPRLLEQMVRNLLSNALKYTKNGKVLLGCRRREGALSIEIWDTGIGIPAAELEPIFEEYHRVDDASRERDPGLGLGLSIVRHLGKLLGHPVRVRSRPGHGSVFSIEVALAPSGARPQPQHSPRAADEEAPENARRTGTILIVEDDPDVRELLEIYLEGEGHGAASVPDGVAALELVATEAVRPDLLIVDFNLPRAMDGLQVTAKLREILHRQIPAIILTGETSTGTLRDIARQNCTPLNKPVKLSRLTQVVQRLLPAPQGRAQPPASPVPEAEGGPASSAVFVVDDDDQVRETIREVLEDVGYAVEDFADCEAFLEAYRPGRDACLLIDAYLPGMTGLELLQRLHAAGDPLPAVMITGSGDVPMAVEAMKAGALDFLEKPISRDDLLASIARSCEQSRDATKLAAWRKDAAKRFAGITSRQRQVMERVLAGQPSKIIAADLGISQRTVENHRASIMKRTGAKSLPALARLAVAAGRIGVEDDPRPALPPSRQPQRNGSST